MYPPGTKFPPMGAYNSVMQKLVYREHHVEVQILDNEVSAEFKKTIVKNWGDSYQLVPPNVDRRNVAERAIRKFKSQFLAILYGVDPDFPKFMWDNLLVQTELTINLLRQATINPRMSAWEYYNGGFDYTATPLVPIGCKIIIHNTSNKRKSWEKKRTRGIYCRTCSPTLSMYSGNLQQNQSVNYHRHCWIFS